MEETVNILAVGAHPDDIEFGCGGTLIRYAQQGQKIFLLIASRGGAGGDPDQRLQEQERAAEILGASDVFIGQYRDTRLPLDKAFIDFVENAVRNINPGFIFVNYLDDTHQDHRALAYATISATRYIRNVLYYEVPTTQNFTPNVFVNIQDVLDLKVKALEAHLSQVYKTNIEDLSIVDIAQSLANFRGIQGRVKYAEGFVSQRLFICM